MQFNAALRSVVLCTRLLRCVDLCLLTRCILIRFCVISERDNKLVKLDESTIQGLIGELEADSDKDNAAAASQKAKNKVQARLALEKKAAAKQAAQSKKKGKNAEDDDNDDLDDLATFAKGATNKRKKK